VRKVSGSRYRLRDRATGWRRRRWGHSDADRRRREEYDGREGSHL